MNKVLVITGTRKGIGRYLSEYYLEKGLIVIGCSRAESDLRHANYQHFCLDVAEEDAVKAMIVSVVKQYKQIDYLINNAGIAAMNHSLLTPLSTVEHLFQTNVFGTFLFCREVGKFMTRRRFGRIVNLTSVAVPLLLEGEAVYSSSKAAVEQLTKVLAREFGTNGITCNAVGPSPIPTDLIQGVGEERLQKLLARQTIHEFGTYEDVANVVDFFFSDRSNMITGQILYLAGGG